MLPLQYITAEPSSKKVQIQKVQDTTLYDVQIYTDGSKAEDKVGAAVAIFRNRNF